MLVLSQRCLFCVMGLVFDRRRTGCRNHIRKCDNRLCNVWIHTLLRTIYILIALHYSHPISFYRWPCWWKWLHWKSTCKVPTPWARRAINWLCKLKLLKIPLSYYEQTSRLWVPKVQNRNCAGPAFFEWNLTACCLKHSCQSRRFKIEFCIYSGYFDQIRQTY